MGSAHNELAPLLASIRASGVSGNYDNHKGRRYLVDGLASSLLLLFALDQLLKLASILHFFHRPLPSAPDPWPSLTLFQPITRGVSSLAASLRARALLDYPATIHHLWICDERDRAAQEQCRALLAEFPHLSGQLLLAKAVEGRAVASKIEKLLVALPHATGEVFWFLDDDVAPRPDAARLLTSSLFQPRAGAVFGLACYTNWRTLWSSLMSAFVNANALLSYIPLTYLIEPFTITGHCFALRREVFERAGGFDGMEGRIDDDHDLARRMRKLGLRNVQTLVIYDVDNDFDSWQAYSKQIKRWFVFPRQAMLPFMGVREQVVSLVGSLGQLLPGLLLLLFLFTWKRSAFRALLACLGLFGAVYLLNEICYEKRRTPLKGWLMLPVVALFVPLQILWALVSNNEIEWRGQRMRISIGGRMEIVGESKRQMS
ncbi:MAG: glycosyltransferase [Ktedonobacteraceae bacterium]|nr:glycosyltransferase [Ktedonobacteraceae bacterium]